MTLLGFELRLALRSRWVAGAALMFAVLSAGVTAMGLSTYRVLGLGSGSPAAIALLDLGLLVPTAFALIAGGTSLGADREGGFLAMLRAAGFSAARIVTAKVAAATAASWLILGAGYGASALVLAGNVPASELPAFGAIVAAACAATLSSAAIGVLIAAATRQRHEALVASIAAWFVLAVGLELIVLALGPLTRGGAASLLLLLLVDPLESARALGLLALGLDGELLGSLGAYLASSQGRLGASSVLAAALLLWAAAPGLIAARLIERRDT